MKNILYFPDTYYVDEKTCITALNSDSFILCEIQETSQAKIPESESQVGIITRNYGGINRFIFKSILTGLQSEQEAIHYC